MSTSHTVVCNSNQNGQIVIPVQFRKKYKIFPKQKFSVSPFKNGLYIEPINENTQFNWQETVISYFPSAQKKKGGKKDFSFSTDGKESNLAEEMDDILYA